MALIAGGATAGRSRYLSGTEQAVLEVRRHPFSLARAGAAALGALLGASIIGSLTSWEKGNDAIDTFVGLVAIGFVVRLLWKILVWWEDRIVVTDQRIFEVSGVLTRKVASMPLEKVTDMTYRRTILGRMLGYGDLIMETAGQKQAMDEISYLPRPDAFYRTVTSLVNSHPPPARVLFDQTGPRGPDEDDTGPLPRIVL
ncbi:MAG: PH domain-containing protein [Actinomycetota bacterium]|nr:PH domain-containing protein [Actinomycetota bacterium]